MDGQERVGSTRARSDELLGQTGVADESAVEAALRAYAAVHPCPGFLNGDGTVTGCLGPLSGTGDCPTCATVVMADASGVAHNGQMEIKPDVRTNYYLNGDCPNCGRHRLELYVDGPEGNERAVGIKCEKCYVGWLLDPNGPGAMFHGDLSEDDPLNPVDPREDDWLKPSEEPPDGR